MLRQLPCIRGIENLNDVIIEDWTCPGLENLVLPWIERTVEEFGYNKPVKAVLENLTTLLNRYWVQTFER